MTAPYNPEHEVQQQPVLAPDLGNLTVREVRRLADEHASQLMDRYWDDDLFPVDPYRIASTMGVRVWEGDFEGDISGMYKSDATGQNIYINRRDSGNRKRFTVSHELGHASCNPGGAFIDRKRAQLAREGTDREEIFANEFAACLLMPRYAVERLCELGWSTVEMADFFGVSNTAMGFRRDNLGMA